MRPKRPAALTVGQLAAVPGPGQPAARTRGDRFAGSGKTAASGAKKGVPALSVHDLGKRFGDRIAFLLATGGDDTAESVEGEGPTATTATGRT